MGGFSRNKGNFMADWFDYIGPLDQQIRDARRSDGSSIEWDDGQAMRELIPHSYRLSEFKKAAREWLKSKARDGKTCGLEPYISPRCVEILEMAKFWGVEAP